VKSSGDGVRDLEHLGGCGRVGRVCLRWGVLGGEVRTYVPWTDLPNCSLYLRGRERERESGLESSRGKGRKAWLFARCKLPGCGERRAGSGDRTRSEFGIGAGVGSGIGTGRVARFTTAKVANCWT
jgi:hypothetical protein